MVLILSWGGMLVSHVKPVSLGVLCVSSDTADSSIHGMSLLNSFLIVGRGDLGSF